MFNTGFLLASLVWGSVGMGYFIYGKRQRSFPPMGGEILMIAMAYLIASALWMSLVCLGIVGAVYFLIKRGY